MSLCRESSLNGTWQLKDQWLSFDDHLKMTVDGEDWMDAVVPGDIHQALLDAGRIPEPLVGLNSFDCAWTEKRSWWFRKGFDFEPAWADAEVVDLTLDGLDSNASIFLNGRPLGCHPSAFRPFVTDIKSLLKEGENILLVRLTAGLETVSEGDVDAPDGVRPSTEAFRGRLERGDIRRTMIRKPQYSFGWDWSPRVPTTAIAGDVVIRAMKQAAIRDVELRPIRHGEKDVFVTAALTVEKFHYYQSAEGKVSLILTDESGERFVAEADIFLRSGENFVDLPVLVSEAKLWWPGGLGDQHRYRVEASLEVAGERMDYPGFSWGIRFLELETGDGVFALKVNGKRIFCKGANWVPADAVYACVSDERYEQLVAEAAGANFNMLRIWGGGLYERDAFYDACDRHGILVWHDFMFACAAYPDHLESFRREVELEADHQTRRLRRYACMGLWSGNNECSWGFRDWWDEKTRGGAVLYNYILPRAVRRNCPEIPYWNGSPYGGEAPNGCEAGDRHHWHDCMMNSEMGKRIAPEEYDKCESLFVSEFGYVGACSKETTLAYLGETPSARAGGNWDHHTNTFEQGTVAAGIRKHYVDPEGLSLDDYLLYSGLCQGLMYGYALEAHRYRANCHGSLFWMYEDCWGEVGWTIIDYYLRRKPSWYFVRRAYAPVRLILRDAGDGRIRLVVANDTARDFGLEVETGWMALDNSSRDVQTVKKECVALSRTEIAVFERGDQDPRKGLWVARPIGQSDILPAIFRAVDFRQLEKVDPQLSWEFQEDGGARRVVISAKAYAHGVRLELPEGAAPSDNYFDLLPGEQRVIDIRAETEITRDEIRVLAL
ncbi:beta-mannosidase [bacterium]|nr:beta-mannosidase [bacterium]